MRKFATTVSAFALVVSTSFTPAFAAVDPVYGGAYPDLDAQCDALLNPSDSSGFVTYADVDPGTGITVSTVTVDTGVISTVGEGTPTTSGTTFVSAHVHGQSPNIFAQGNLTVTYPAKKVTYSTQTTVTTTVTGSCHVHKETNGANQETIHPGYQIAPNGLQGQGETVSSSSSVVTTGTREEIIQGPWVDPNASTTGVDFVICISPGPSNGPKGGTWRTQNGYVNGTFGPGSTCSTTWYYQLQAINPIPSESLPPA